MKKDTRSTGAPPVRQNPVVIESPDGDVISLIDPGSVAAAFIGDEGDLTMVFIGGGTVTMTGKDTARTTMNALVSAIRRTQ